MMATTMMTMMMMMMMMMQSLILVWILRDEVLPLLLDIGSPKSSFPIYSVVFHEV